MRTLTFKNPVPIKETAIYKGDSFENPKTEYYSRFSTVFTKFGVVTVLDFDWMTNSGPSRWTEFRTVIDGEIWMAELREGRLNDFRIKWMATHFIKKCLSAYNGDLLLVNNKQKHHEPQMGK